MKLAVATQSGKSLGTWSNDKYQGLAWLLMDEGSTSSCDSYGADVILNGWAIGRAYNYMDGDGWNIVLT